MQKANRKANRKAKVERHARLNKDIHKTRSAAVLFHLHQFFIKIWKKLRPLIKFCLRVPAKAGGRFSHPLHQTPDPKTFLMKSGIWASLFVLVMSMGNAHSHEFIGEGAGVEYEYLALTIPEAFLTDDDGYIIKNVPLTGEAIYDGDRFEIVEHTVQSGESLSVIAYRYGISINSLLYANEGLKSYSYLSIGQVLNIPPENGLYIAVTEEDTLITLLEKHDGDLEETMDFNQLTENSELIPGQELFIREGHPADEVEDGVFIAESEFVYGGNTDVPDIYIPQPEPDPNPELTPEPVESPVEEIAEVPVETPVEEPVAEQELDHYEVVVSDEGWIRPTTGIITQGYRAGHYAYDIADRSMPPILAARSGIITEVDVGGWGNGYGNHITIDHGDGYTSLYAHCNEVYVVEGQYVAQGDVIAQMGNTGQVYGVTGIHLHLVLTYNGEKVSPAIMGVW